MRSSSAVLLLCLAAVGLLLCNGCSAVCGRGPVRRSGDAQNGTAPADVAETDSPATDDHGPVADAFRPVFYEPHELSGWGMGQVSRLYGGRLVALAAGLSEEEAAFEGNWDYLTHGIRLSMDKTFVYWSAIPDEEDLGGEPGKVHEPAARIISRGTWSVLGGRLRLDHKELKGEALRAPMFTLHDREEFAASEDGLSEDES